MTLYKNILWATLILLIVASTFSLLFETATKTTELTISQLAAKINNGEIAAIIVRGNELAIDLKDGTRATSKKETEFGLSQTLNNYNVTPKALSAVNIEVRDESGMRFWLGILLPTLLPLLIIGAMFWFI